MNFSKMANNLLMLCPMKDLKMVVVNNSGNR